MDECEVCYAQVKQDALMGHYLWHSQQRELQELTTRNLEGVLKIIERMTGRQ